MDNRKQNQIISILLRHPEAVQRVRASDFENSKIKNIFAKVFKGMQDNPDTTPDYWMSELTKEEKQYCVLASQEFVADAAITATVNAFVDEALQRQLNETMFELAMENSNVIEYQSFIDRLQERTAAEADSIEDYLNDFDTVLETIPLAYERIDCLLGGGIAKGTVATIGARPSVGKTTLAINIAKNNPDKKIQFFSLEMSKRMIYDRLLSDELNIDYTRMGNHQLLTADEKEDVHTILDIHKKFKVIDNTYNIEDILCKVNTGTDMVIIDYVQIIKTLQDFKEPRLRIDYISQQIKSFAKRKCIPFLILSQLTRAGKDRPTMSDLKESGGLEQDSDYVFLLHRPYVQDKKSKEYKPSEAELILDKNKFGDTGVIELNFDGKYQRFTEVLKKEEKIARPINNEEIVDDLPF